MTEQTVKCPLFKKLVCCLFGHQYVVLKEFSTEVRQVGCSRCFRRWGMNDRVKAFVAWDAELETFHNEMKD